MAQRRLASGRALALWPARGEPASHFNAGAIEYEKAVGRGVGVFSFHLGESRLAGLHNFVQVLVRTILDLNWISFLSMNNPLDIEHALPLFATALR